MAKTISEKINCIKREIPEDVKLIAITKQVDVKLMQEAYDAGVKDFGENRLQEALDKQQQLKKLTQISWHFIGHIQKNKARKIIEHFVWIHSVDSLALAKRLNRIAGELNKIPKVFLQTKILPDPNKYGWQVESLWQDLEELNRLNQLEIQGLMTILPLGISESEILAFIYGNVRRLSTSDQSWSYYDSLRPNNFQIVKHCSSSI